MSKYSEEMEKSMIDTRNMRRITKDLIKGGSELALKEYYKASSYERLKGRIMK